MIKKNNIQYDYDGKANVGDCQGLPKHIFKIIRGYDEDFEGWGWGDEDFAARIKRMGLKEIWIEDKTSIFHQGHKVNKKRKVKDAAHHQKLMIEKYKKHKLSVIRNTETDWGKIK